MHYFVPFACHGFPSLSFLLPLRSFMWFFFLCATTYRHLLPARLGPILLFLFFFHCPCLGVCEGQTRSLCCLNIHRSVQNNCNSSSHIDTSHGIETSGGSQLRHNKSRHHVGQFHPKAKRKFHQCAYSAVGLGDTIQSQNTHRVVCVYCLVSRLCRPIDEVS